VLDSSYRDHDPHSPKDTVAKLEEAFTESILKSAKATWWQPENIERGENQENRPKNQDERRRNRSASRQKESNATRYSEYRQPTGHPF